MYEDVKVRLIKANATALQTLLTQRAALGRDIGPHEAKINGSEQQSIPSQSAPMGRDEATLLVSDFKV